MGPAHFSGLSLSNNSPVFTCLPTVNRGQLAASVGALAAGTELGEVLAAYLAAAGRG